MTCARTDAHIHIKTAASFRGAGFSNMFIPLLDNLNAAY
jgi:hypothetical protein